MAVDTFLEGTEWPKLEEGQPDRCEGLVTKEEVGQALNSMKNGSAPGGNGLTVDSFFFPFFFGGGGGGRKLKIMVTNTFNEAFASELTYTQRPPKNIYI